jgi:hypothetical protein
LLGDQSQPSSFTHRSLYRPLTILSLSSKMAKEKRTNNASRQPAAFSD